MTIELSQLSEIIRSVIRDCGAFILKERQSFTKSMVELKGKADLVSYVDKETEKKLVKGLSEVLSESGFITEENTIDQTKKEYTWIIDPLDGTTNFVHGIPSFAVSVALMHDGEIVLGVVYEVNRDEYFEAWKGGGAFLNQQEINVSDVSSPEESLFSTGFPTDQFSNVDEFMQILRNLLSQSHGIRRMGSAAADLAYVACGRLEGFFEYNLKPWDVAAGALIVQEAGGIVTDFSGGSDYLFGREIVVAGPVHGKLLDVIKADWKY